MATTYTWGVVQMDAYPEYEGETDVVFSVHWTLTGEEAGFTGYVYGSVGVSLTPGAPFTPYADLTEAQVIGWVQDALGEEQVVGVGGGGRSGPLRLFGDRFGKVGWAWRYNRTVGGFADGRGHEASNAGGHQR